MRARLSRVGGAFIHAVRYRRPTGKPGRHRSEAVTTRRRTRLAVATITALAMCAALAILTALATSAACQLATAAPLWVAVPAIIFPAVGGVVLQVWALIKTMPILAEWVHELNLNGNR